MPRVVPQILSFILLAACNGPDPDPIDSSPPDEPVVVDTLPNGLYAMNFGVSAVGGLAVPFQLDVQSTQTGEDAPVFSRFDLRAVGADDVLSDVLASAAGTAATETGFSADLGEFVLPGEFSVTGSAITIDAVLEGESAKPEGLCGTLTGNLITFDIDLAGSTFGAVPWDARADGIPTSCDTGTVEEIPRIETCPALVGGAGTIVSGGETRSYEIVLPASYDPGQDWPLLFVFHGFGGDIASMLDEAQLRPYADTFGQDFLPAPGAILVVPQGEDVGGTDGWDAFSDPRTNLDLVLFDDLLTCAQQSFSIDTDRIHVTGMSNGGLFTGYLLATRSSVFASAVPMSGGMGITPEDPATPPVLALWGGEDDLAFDQDFNLLTTQMMDTLEGRGDFVVGCNHGLGHTLDPSFWPWSLQFLAEHPKGVSPEPYLGGLPAIFPEYCALW